VFEWTLSSPVEFVFYCECSPLWATESFHRRCFWCRSCRRSRSGVDQWWSHSMFSFGPHIENTKHTLMTPPVTATDNNFAGFNRWDQSSVISCQLSAAASDAGRRSHVILRNVILGQFANSSHTTYFHAAVQPAIFFCFTYSFCLILYRSKTARVIRCDVTGWLLASIAYICCCLYCLHLSHSCTTSTNGLSCFWSVDCRYPWHIRVRVYRK